MLEFHLLQFESGGFCRGIYKFDTGCLYYQLKYASAYTDLNKYEKIGSVKNTLNSASKSVHWIIITNNGVLNENNPHSHTKLSIHGIVKPGSGRQGK